MSKIPTELKYTKSHEWVKSNDDGSLTIGITDHAQEALGDIVFLELPEPGRTLEAGEACAVVESVKAASDIYAPLGGEVVEANSALIDTPEQLNDDAYAAWLFRIMPADAGAVDQLLSADDYAKESEG